MKATVDIPSDELRDAMRFTNAVASAASGAVFRNRMMSFHPSRRTLRHVLSPRSKPTFANATKAQLGFRRRVARRHDRQRVLLDSELVDDLGAFPSARNRRGAAVDRTSPRAWPPIRCARTDRGSTITMRIARAASARK
jgi:hypothetical protein